MDPTRSWSRAKGVSLIETMMFITIVSIALIGTMYSYVRHLSAKSVTEQRRQASIAAEQKLDEIRSYVRRVPAGNAVDIYGQIITSSNPLFKNPLNAAYQMYGPFPLTGNQGALNRPCCFSVPNLNPINTDPIGTVTIITSETPDESQFGYIYDGSTNPNKFGVNINGDIYQDVQLPSTPTRAGTFPTGTSTSSSTSTSAAPTVNPSPFPLDINGNGVATDTTVGSSPNDNFTLLPIVITIRWLDTNGNRQRFDLFAILQAESQQ